MVRPIKIEDLLGVPKSISTWTKSPESFAAKSFSSPEPPAASVASCAASWRKWHPQTRHVLIPPRPRCTMSVSSSSTTIPRSISFPSSASTCQLNACAWCSKPTIRKSSSAAAYKHVPLMEKTLRSRSRQRVIGSRQVADMAVEYGAEKMVMVSTDKAVNPTNVMEPPSGWLKSTSKASNGPSAKAR